MSVTPQKRPVQARAEPFVLPQWAIAIVRMVLRRLFELIWHMRLVNTEYVRQNGSGGLIIAANHQTYIDPFWVASPVKRPLRFLAWDESFSWPIVGKIMRWLGAWPLQLDRSDPRTIRRSLQWLRNGGALVIFPEGGRAFANGAMLDFKLGAARLALEANVPILPVTIRGGNRIWPRGQRFPARGCVELIYHPLRRITQLPGEDTRQCARRETDQLAEIIRSAL